MADNRQPHPYLPRFVQDPDVADLDPQALLDGTTPGPWHWVDPDDDVPKLPQDGVYRLSLRTVDEPRPFLDTGTLPIFIIGTAEEFETAADARLIAAAPGLAAALMEAQEEIDRLRAEVRSLRSLAEHGERC
jgi:hypothetical protein